MTKMIAAKGFTYATRRLMAEDPFVARSREDARLMVALGRARYATEDGRAADERPVKRKPAPKPKAAAKAPRAPRKPKEA